MTVKLVESIRKAEQQAEDLIREAQQKALQVVREAEEQAVGLLNEGIAAAREQAKELLAKAETEARQETAARAGAHQKEIEDIKSEAGARLPEAVAMIAGKVVNIYADS